MAGRACHVVASATQVGLTQALDLMTKDLNHSEKAALEKLRKLQSQWPGFRWVLLLLGIFNILNGLSSYFRHGDHAFGLLAFFIGLVAIVLTWRDWSGNATRTLLLKLYDEE